MQPPALSYHYFLLFPLVGSHNSDNLMQSHASHPLSILYSPPSRTSFARLRSGTFSHSGMEALTVNPPWLAPYLEKTDALHIRPAQ